eukprot:gene14395-27853_t
MGDAVLTAGWGDLTLLRRVAAGPPDSGNGGGPAPGVWRATCAAARADAGDSDDDGEHRADGESGGERSPRAAARRRRRCIVRVATAPAD